MKLVEIFKQLAGKAEENLGGLAHQQLSNLEKRKALRQIEDRFEQMAADGYIDKAELDELMRSLAAQGLDAGSLQTLFAELKNGDSTSRVSAEDGSKFAEAVDDLLGDAMQEATQSQTDVAFEIQMQMADATNYGYAASQLSKQEHSVYMNIISNMKA